MITIQEENSLSLNDFIFLLDDSGLGKRRPMDDLKLLQKMVEGANFWVTARNNGDLVGVIRGLSDRCYRCFIADLAISKDFQKQGIGTRMLEYVRNGYPEARIFLFSAEDAEPFYLKLGFKLHDRCYQWKRE